MGRSGYGLLSSFEIERGVLISMLRNREDYGKCQERTWLMHGFPVQILSPIVLLTHEYKYNTLVVLPTTSNLREASCDDSPLYEYQMSLTPQLPLNCYQLQYQNSNKYYQLNIRFIMFRSVFLTLLKMPSLMYF